VDSAQQFWSMHEAQDAESWCKGPHVPEATPVPAASVAASLALLASLSVRAPPSLVPLPFVRS
jgi:hypothetical protein